MYTPSEEKTDATLEVRTLYKDLLLLSLLFGALFMAFLGSYPLANPDEGRYAEIAREMVSTGDWVLPRLNDVFYFEKPPLVYWANALGLRLFGGSEWGLRAVPAGFAVLGLLFTYLGGRGLGGRVAGWVAALLTGTSLLYFIIGRILILDMPVSALITGTLVCFMRGVKEPAGPRRRYWFWGLYACAALATLAKGLIGLAIPGAVMFLWLLVFNQWIRLLPMHLLSGAFIYLAIAAPWHLLAAQRHPGWAWFYFVHEHWLRFTTTIHDRYQPWWYFVPVLLAGFFPWTLHLWGGLKRSFSGGWRARDKHASSWFLLLWALFIFLFFSRSQSKLVPYIVPLFPALGILTGRWIAEVIEWKDWKALRMPAYSFFGFTFLLGTAFAVLAFIPELSGSPEVVVATRGRIFMLVGILYAGGLGALLLQRRGDAVKGLLWQAFSWCVALVVIASASPQIQTRSSRAVAEVFAAKAKAGEQVYHYKCFAHDFVYYTGVPVGFVEHRDELGYSVDSEAEKSGRFIDFAEFERRWAGSDRVWMLTRKTEALALQASGGERYHLIANRGRYYLFSNQP